MSFYSGELIFGKILRLKFVGGANFWNFIVLPCHIAAGVVEVKIVIVYYTYVAIVPAIVRY